MASKTAIISHLEEDRVQNTVPPMLWATASDHQLWATTSEKCGNRYTRMVCFIYSRWDWRGDHQVRQTYLQWTWPDHLQQFLLLRILQQNLFETNQKERTLYSPFLRKTWNAKSAKCTKVTRAHCRISPDDRADRIEIAEKFGYTKTAYHKIINQDQESRLHRRYAVLMQDLAS